MYKQNATPMPSRSNVFFCVCFVAIKDHSLTALRLDADTPLASMPQNQMTSCQMFDLFDFHDVHTFPNSALNYTMSRLYGHRDSLNNDTWAPAAWASYSSTLPLPWRFSQTSDSSFFNQFMLEEVMLAKWRGSGKCCTAPEGTCTGQEDILVYPSFIMNLRQKYGSKNVRWKTTRPDKQQIFAYWNTIYERHYKSGRKPLIVTHMSFVWDFNLFLAILQVLSEFPKEFVDNVIIGGLEAHVRFRDQEAMANKLPRLVSLPYPVGVVNAVSFTSRDISGFDPNRDRPIIISFEGSWSDGPRFGGNLVRPYLHHSFKNYIGKSNRNLHICRDPNADAQHTCGLKMDSVFERSLNSVFCLEPAGDTLTRSHLYVAILTGCVPVIFDGGHELYAANETQWAWRKTHAAQSSQFVDYSAFAVVYKYDDLAHVNWVQDLIDMPVKHPDRLLELRRGLDKIAPSMMYSPEGNARDAFNAFVTEINDFRFNPVWGAA